MFKTSFSESFSLWLNLSSICFAAFLYLMYSAYLLAFFIYHVHLLPEPAYLNLGAKNSGIIAPKNESFEELEFAYRRQLIEHDQFFMFTLVCHPVCVASY